MSFDTETSCAKKAKRLRSESEPFLDGAGRGNRTLLASLEGWSITTMLYPHYLVRMHRGFLGASEDLR